MTQRQLFEQRQRLLEKQLQALMDKVASTERTLFTRILETVLKRIQLEGDTSDVHSVKANFDVVVGIDNAFDEFQKTHQYGLLDQMVGDFNALANHIDLYYEGFKLETDYFRNIKKQVRDFMRKRIGLDTDGKIIKGGWFDQVARDQSTRQRIKELTFRAVTSGQPLAEYTDALHTELVGGNAVDGSLTKYYKSFAFDSYMQFDRSTNLQFANRLNMRVFIYSGGIIETSRDFCIKNNDKLFTIEEAENFRRDPDLPKTKEERETGVVSNYIPTIDLGRWRCHHLARFISITLAIKLRPDLKNYYVNFPDAR